MKKLKSRIQKLESEVQKLNAMNMSLAEQKKYVEESREYILSWMPQRAAEVFLAIAKSKENKFNLDQILFLFPEDFSQKVRAEIDIINK